MKRVKRCLKSMGIGLAVTGLLSGCATGRNIVFDPAREPSGPQTSLTFFGFKYEPVNVTAIEDALHGYMDAYPNVTIAYDGIKGADYYDILNKRLSTGHGDDIFMVDHERVLELAGQGKLADLSDLSTLDTFSDLAKSQMTVGGTIRYLPTTISAFGLYVNTALLKEHRQKSPENLTELEAVCAYFVSKGITPIVANNDISLKTVAIARALLPLYQSSDIAAALARFNSGEDDLAETLRPGFALVERLIERGWVDAELALKTEKTKDDLAQFAKGEQPFMLTGAWAAHRLRELAPALAFEVRPYPIMEDGGVLVINMDTRVSVLADTPNLKEAKQFVEYLTQKDVMWEFVSSQSSFSPLKDNRLAEDTAIQSLGPYLANGRSVIGSDDNLRYPIWDMTRQCVAGMLEGDDAQAAVSRMRTLIDTWSDANAEG